jgi:hypothetical protein
MIHANSCSGSISADGAPTASEALRQLSIARTEQVRLQNEIIRKERMPLDDVRKVDNEVYQAIAGIIKASGLRSYPSTTSLLSFAIFRIAWAGTCRHVDTLQIALLQRNPFRSSCRSLDSRRSLARIARH